MLEDVLVFLPLPCCGSSESSQSPESIWFCCLHRMTDKCTGQSILLKLNERVPLCRMNCVMRKESSILTGFSSYSSSLSGPDEDEAAIKEVLNQSDEQDEATCVWHSFSVVVWAGDNQDYQAVITAVVLLWSSSIKALTARLCRTQAAVQVSQWITLCNSVSDWTITFTLTNPEGFSQRCYCSILLYLMMRDDPFPSNSLNSCGSAFKDTSFKFLKNKDLQSVSLRESLRGLKNAAQQTFVLLWFLPTLQQLDDKGGRKHGPPPGLGSARTVPWCLWTWLLCC